MCRLHARRLQRCREHQGRPRALRRGVRHPLWYAHLLALRQHAAQIPTQASCTSCKALSSEASSLRELESSSSHLPATPLSRLSVRRRCVLLFLLVSADEIHSGDLERVLARPKDGPVDETSTPATRYDASKAVQLLGVCHEHIKLRASREDGPRLVFVSPGFVPTTALSRELAWPLRLASTWLLPLMPFATSIDSAASIVVHALTMTEAEASGQGELPLYIGVKRGGGTETRQIDERLVHALLTTELDQEEVRALELWCPRDSSKTARLLV